MRPVPCLTLLASLLLASPALADALVENVDGMTLNERGEVVRFTGMVISPEGKVVKLLKRGDKRPEKLDWKEDLKGRTVIPGMVDGHGHVMELGFRALSLDLSGATSLAQAQEAIRRYSAANTQRPWLVGGGWNEESWGLGRLPNAAELDAATGERPAWLVRADRQAGWANSAAMRAAGVTAATKAPIGGRIELAGGKPGGVFVGAAMALIEKALPKPTPRDRNAAFIKAQDILLSNGVTATADMGTTLDDWMTYRRMGDLGILRLRIMSYSAGVEVALQVGGSGPTPWLYGDKLRMGGIQLELDGALGSRGAWLKAPYADAPGATGLPGLSDAQLLNSIARGAMDNFQLALHAAGDRANRQALDAIEEVSDTYNGDRRWRIEHAQVVDPADLPRFGRHGVIASMQPAQQPGDRAMAEARLGPQRLAGAYAWKSMLTNKAKLVFGSGYPVESPNPFAGWATAFTRQDAVGQPFGGWRPEEAVSREEAWRAFTIDAAFAGFGEKQFGHLAPGMRADFLVVDRDPMLASPAELRATVVFETWVGGERVYRRGQAEPVAAGR